MSDASNETQRNVEFMDNIGGLIGDVYSNSEDMNKSIDTVNVEMKELKEKVSTIVVSNKKTSQNVKNNLDDSKTLVDSSEGLVRTVDSLKSVVGKFKL